jgi:hypothetical protein
VHFHRLTAQFRTAPGQWSLEWDDSKFLLKGPDGESVIETAAREAYRLVEVYGLYGANRVCFLTSSGWLVFKKDREAMADLRTLLDAGLQSDTDYRMQLAAQAGQIVSHGWKMIAAGSIPFALYCCYCVAWEGRPLPGWFNQVGWLIKAVLFILLGVVIRGWQAVSFGRAQRSLVCRIEQGLANPGAKPTGTNQSF